MKKNIKILLCAVIILVMVTALAACGNESEVALATTELTVLDFGDTLDDFENGSDTTANWNRANIIKTDATTTATINVSHGETYPVIMIKGNSGTMTATSTESGTLDFDASKNSSIGSVLMMKDGETAQVGDGVFKFSMKVSAPYAGAWNNQVVFRLSTPNAMLTDSSVTSALAIQTYDGGDVQLVQNGSPDVVLISDTGVNINDGEYHYFIIAMQDVSGGTSVKLWIDGNVAYSGVVTGLDSTGAIQLYSNSTPQYDGNGSPLVTEGVHEGTFAALTACGESYIGGYNDGPKVSDLSLDTE